MVTPCHPSPELSVLDHVTGTALLVLFYRHLFSLCIWMVMGRLDGLCHPHDVLRNIPFLLSQGGSAALLMPKESILRFVMLEIRQDLKHGVLIIGRGGSRKHPRDSVTVLLTLACLQCQDHFTLPTLKPFLPPPGPGSMEGPFLCSPLPEKQVPPHFQS